MKKAVVTGGAGFIGSHLTDLLLSEGLEVSVIDNLANSSLKNLKNALESPKLTFVEADISKEGEWEDTVRQADYVFHLAGLAAIVPSIENPREYFSTNVTGTLNVLQATKKSASLVYAASSSCYGMPTTFNRRKSTNQSSISICIDKITGRATSLTLGRCLQTISQITSII